MKLNEILTRPGVFSLKDIDGEDTGVTITIRPNEDKVVKAAIRAGLIDMPKRPAENCTDAEALIYMDDMRAIDRKILASRIVTIQGVEDFSNTESDILEFAMQLPDEYVAQIDAFVGERKNFFAKSAKS